MPKHPQGMFNQFFAILEHANGSLAPSGLLPFSPPHLTYTNLGATGTADHLTLLRLFILGWESSVPVEQVTWGDSIISDGWARVFNPYPHSTTNANPNPHKHLGGSTLLFSTDGQTKGWTDRRKEINVAQFSPVMAIESSSLVGGLWSPSFLSAIWISSLSVVHNNWSHSKYLILQN